MTDTILFDVEGPVARLTLNNPAKHNSLGEAELSALQRHLDSVQDNPRIRVLVVTGSGEKTFCAGAALDQLGKGQTVSNTDGSPFCDLDIRGAA